MVLSFSAAAVGSKWLHRLLIGDERKIAGDFRSGFSLALNI
jgi:hypothetical protein